MKRFFAGVLLSIPLVLAHEGEAVETHSASEVFWETVILLNRIWFTGVLVLIAAGISWEGVKRHG